MNSDLPTCPLPDVCGLVVRRAIRKIIEWVRLHSRHFDFSNAADTDVFVRYPFWVIDNASGAVDVYELHLSLRPQTMAFERLNREVNG